jgi:hypothetical protein
VPRAAFALIAVLVLAGCDVGEGSEKQSTKAGPKSRGKPDKRSAARSWPKLPHCPESAGNCASARGTIIYVEAKDPDGDGDAHFVLTSTQSITAPGVTVIDVEKNLRPHPLPGVGDRVAAAGPVYTGSHGQKQIQATTLRVKR